MPAKEKIVKSIEELQVSGVYLEELPEKGEEGQLAVLEQLNQYWKFEKGEWLQINPYFC